MKSISKIFAGMAFATLLVVGVVSGVSYSVSASENVQDYPLRAQVYDRTVYKANDKLDIYDIINGDLYCAGNQIKINGTIEGDIICAGNDLIIDGDVNGDIRVAGRVVEIKGQVTGNATITGDTVTIVDEATINGDVTIIGRNVGIAGTIGRDASIRASAVGLSGVIERNVQSYHSSFVFNGDGSIGGNFKYSSPNRVYIPNDAVEGVVTEETVSPSTNYSNALTSSVFIASFMYIAWFISLLIAALGIAFLFPKSLEDSVGFATKQPLMSGFAGLLLVSITPLLLLILSLSIVGIPLALILGFLFGSVLLLSTPFMAHLLGSLLIPNRSHPIRALAGAVILLLLFAIPIINIFAIILSTIYGAGLVTRVAAQRYSSAHQDYYSKNGK